MIGNKVARALPSGTKITVLTFATPLMKYSAVNF